MFRKVWQAAKTQLDVWTDRQNVEWLISRAKGQLIQKANCQAVNSSKKQMYLFLLQCDIFLFVFWKKLKTPKKTFEIT